MPPSRPRFRARPALLLALLPLALGGCVSRLSLPQRQALDMMVGKSQPALVAALGQPTGIVATPAGSAVLYRWGETVLQADEVGEPDPPQLTLRRHVEFVTHRCDTAFHLSGGVVTSWSVTGSDCHDAPFPYLGGLKRVALAQDAAQGRDLNPGFLFNTRTGDSLVLAGSTQTR